MLTNMFGSADCACAVKALPSVRPAIIAMMVVVFVIDLLVSAVEKISRARMRPYGNTLDLNNIRWTKDFVRIYVFKRDRST